MTSMKLLLVDLHMLDIRKSSIRTGYRPDWISDSKPEFNCARVILRTKDDEIAPGQWAKALLQPLVPEYWKEVGFGDKLSCQEGLAKVGEAIVIDVFEC